jgi:hypothetical protein
VMPLSTIFQLLVYRGSHIGGGNQGTRRKPPTCHKSPTHLCYSCYNPSDMLLMIKGPDGDYEKLNISMVISYFVTVDQVMIATVRNFQSVWSRPSSICGILYFKLNGIDVMEQNHQIQNLGQKKWLQFGDYEKLNISMVISYFVTVDQVMIATVRNFQSDDFNLTTRNPWFSSFLVKSPSGPFIINNISPGL